MPTTPTASALPRRSGCWRDSSAPVSRSFWPSVSIARTRRTSRRNSISTCIPSSGLTCPLSQRPIDPERRLPRIAAHSPSRTPPPIVNGRRRSRRTARRRRSWTHRWDTCSTRSNALDSRLTPSSSSPATTGTTSATTACGRNRACSSAARGSRSSSPGPR